MSTPNSKPNTPIMSTPVSDTSTSFSSPVSALSTPNSNTYTNSTAPTTYTSTSDLQSAINESYERFRYMNADDLLRERADSCNSAAAAAAANINTIRVCDYRKYIRAVGDGTITLAQVQMTANAARLPEEHRAIRQAVYGKEQPLFGCSGRVTYDAYPLPVKRKRDALSETFESVVKKVKGAFEK